MDASDALAHDAPPLDLDGLFARCMGNLDLVERVLTSFESRFADDLEELESAFRQLNSDAVRTLAHRMKGASANAGASMLMAETSQIELLAETGRLDEVPSRLAGLRREWQRFRNADRRSAQVNAELTQ